MNIVICGQGLFASEVLKGAVELGHKVTAIFTKSDQSLLACRAREAGARVYFTAINAEAVPDGTDLIVSVHCFDFISEKARLRSTYGAIGYHPSLLPIHKGRSSIEWCIKLGDRITGGTVFKLSNDIDGGDIVRQRHVIVSKKETVQSLWRDKLQPLGTELILSAINEISEKGMLAGEKQNEADSTWFPSMERPPVKRPDLFLIEDKRAG